MTSNMTSDLANRMLDRQSFIITILVFLFVLNLVKAVMIAVQAVYMVRFMKTSKEMLELSKQYAHSAVSEAQQTRSEMKESGNATRRKIDETSQSRYPNQPLD